MLVKKKNCLNDYFNFYFCDVCFKFYKEGFYTERCGCGCEESVKCCRRCKYSSFVQTTAFCGC